MRRSGGRTKIILVIDCLGTWCVGIPLCLLAAYGLRWGIVGVICPAQRRGSVPAGLVPCDVPQAQLDGVVHTGGDFDGVEGAGRQNHALGVDHNSVAVLIGAGDAHGSALGIGQDGVHGGVQHAVDTALCAVLLHQGDEVCANGDHLALSIGGAVDTLDGCAAEAGNVVQGAVPFFIRSYLHHLANSSSVHLT